MNTKIPIIVWTDLTYDLYQKTYFSNFNKIHSKSIKNGNYLENKTLNKAKLLIYSTNYAALSAVENIKFQIIK